MWVTGVSTALASCVQKAHGVCCSPDGMCSDWRTCNNLQTRPRAWRVESWPTFTTTVPWLGTLATRRVCTYTLGSLEWWPARARAEGTEQVPQTSLPFQAPSSFHLSCHCCKRSPCIREEVGEGADVLESRYMGKDEIISTRQGCERKSPNLYVSYSVLRHSPQDSLCCRGSNPGPPCMLN